MARAHGTARRKGGEAEAEEEMLPICGAREAESTHAAVLGNHTGSSRVAAFR